MRHYLILALSGFLVAAGAVLLLAGCAQAAGSCVSDGVMTTLWSTDQKTGCEKNGGAWIEYATEITTAEIKPWMYGLPRSLRQELVLEKVAHKGDESCSHDWVSQEDEPGSPSNYLTVRYSCAVYHGPCGCPDEWPRIGRICRKCLRKEIQVQRCEVVTPPLTEYERLDKMVPK